MEMNPGALPRPAGCRSSFGGGGGTERVSSKRVPVPRVFGRGVNIGEGGSREDPQGSQEAPWRAQGGAAPGTLLGPWWWPSFPLLVLPEGSFTLIFNIIFPEFFGHFK